MHASIPLNIPQIDMQSNTGPENENDKHKPKPLHDSEPITVEIVEKVKELTPREKEAIVAELRKVSISISSSDDDHEKITVPVISQAELDATKKSSSSSSEDHANIESPIFQLNEDGKIVTDKRIKKKKHHHHHHHHHHHLHRHKHDQIDNPKPQKESSKDKLSSSKKKKDTSKHTENEKEKEKEPTNNDSTSSVEEKKVIEVKNEPEQKTLGDSEDARQRQSIEYRREEHKTKMLKE